MRSPGVPILIIGAMCEGAQQLWPRLSRDKFFEIAENVLKENDRDLSIQEVNDLLTAELTRLYGLPANRPSRGTS